MLSTYFPIFSPTTGVSVLKNRIRSFHASVGPELRATVTVPSSAIVFFDTAALSETAGGGVVHTAVIVHSPLTGVGDLTLTMVTRPLARVILP
ncbi:hypothetical protein NpNSSI1_00001080 [Neofusicoccum parvum]|nr:hypothetical protein NpNSSI1_00001080 [Neofusicoccum parvum]